LEEATAIDTAFAMAYRKLAVTLNNIRAERSLRAEAATNAFLHRDRLANIERYLATAYYYYGVAYEPESVRTHYLNVLDVDPENRVALNNLAVLLNGLNERAEAEHYALRAVGAVGISPNYSNALSAQVAQGAFSRADSTLRRFEAESPDNLGALFLRGALMSAQRQFEEAEAHFSGLRERLANRPGPLRVVYDDLSALSRVRGKLAAGERYLREVSNLSADFDQAFRYVNATIVLARLQMEYRDAPDEALSLVEAALHRYPLDSMPALDRPYLDLANFYADAGRPNEARVLVDEFEEVVDESFRRRDADNVYEARGHISLAEGRADEAVTLFRAEQEEERCPTCGDFQLAQAYERAGELDSALVEYERLVTTPTLSRVFRDASYLAASYKRLGELHEARNNRERAIEFYNLFVELWDEADAELQDQVRDVRERIARLIAEPEGEL
jgi:tetratricopeptide (TPR) repeat protein